mgnify:CR=1 FL=1|tara:strand:+ start:6087 stop:6233 length:147 start_codon:yes stop_codon:yes gene_type:complete
MALGQTHGGKGSTVRPTDNRKRFENNYDAVFGKQKNTEKKTKEKKDNG